MFSSSHWVLALEQSNSQSSLWIQPKTWTAPGSPKTDSIALVKVLLLPPSRKQRRKSYFLSLMFYNSKVPSHHSQLSLTGSIYKCSSFWIRLAPILHVRLMRKSPNFSEQCFHYKHHYSFKNTFPETWPRAMPYIEITLQRCVHCGFL